MSYNGWTNYETWCVKLWMDNQESSYTFWKDVTQAVWRDADIERPDYLTKSEAARQDLADVLKEEHLDRMPDLSNTVYADLLASALDEVCWFEIADNLLAENKTVTKLCQSRSIHEPSFSHESG